MVGKKASIVNRQIALFATSSPRMELTVTIEMFKTQCTIQFMENDDKGTKPLQCASSALVRQKITQFKRPHRSLQRTIYLGLATVISPALNPLSPS